MPSRMYAEGILEHHSGWGDLANYGSLDLQFEASFSGDDPGDPTTVSPNGTGTAGVAQFPGIS